MSKSEQDRSFYQIFYFMLLGGSTWDQHQRIHSKLIICNGNTNLLFKKLMDDGQYEYLFIKGKKESHLSVELNYDGFLEIEHIKY